MSFLARCVTCTHKTWNKSIVVTCMMRKRRPKAVTLFILAICFGVLMIVGYGLYTEQWNSMGSRDNRYWFADSSNEVADVKRRFDHRNAYTRRACSRLKEKLRDTYQSEKALIYIQEKKTLFCPVLKASSTLWKKVLYSISEPMKQVQPLEIQPSRVYEWEKTRRITSKTTLSNIVDGSLSFMFVRDPYTKLFSGWLDKFYSVNMPKWKEGKSIIKAERKNASERSLRCGHDVSFKEIVSFVSKKILAGEKLDLHFHTSFSSCDVCKLHFAYIGKFETLEEDAKFIVNRIPGGEHINLGEIFKTESILGTIKGEVEFLFLMKRDKQFSTCVSVQCAMFRVWQRFVCRGIIGTEIPFPYTTKVLANQETKESFIGKLTDAHNKSNKTNLAKNRREALAEVYSTLDKDTLDRFQDAFDVDFELFGYSKRPLFLHVDGTVSKVKEQGNYRYLQDCPY